MQGGNRRYEITGLSTLETNKKNGCFSDYNPQSGHHSLALYLTPWGLGVTSVCLVFPLSY